MRVKFNWKHETTLLTYEGNCHVAANLRLTIAVYNSYVWEIDMEEVVPYMS